MSETVCSLCHDLLDDGTPTAACPACGSKYHEACRDENDGCGTFGCPEAPSAVKQAVAVMPPTFWGKETKTCPACGEEIKAAALRCRHCSATFDSSEPMAPEDYVRRRSLRRAKDTAVRRARAVLIWSLLPPAAPVTICLAAIGRFRTRGARKGDVQMTRLLYVLAMGTSALWMLIVGLALLLS